MECVVDAHQRVAHQRRCSGLRSPEARFSSSSVKMVFVYFFSVVSVLYLQFVVLFLASIHKCEAITHRRCQSICGLPCYRPLRSILQQASPFLLLNLFNFFVVVILFLGRPVAILAVIFVVTANLSFNFPVFQFWLSLLATYEF